jgi:hypothetical protein
MYECYMRSGVKSKMAEAVHMQSGAMFLRKGLEAKHQLITDEARVSFMEAWGYTPDEQTALERYYEKLVLTYGVTHLENLEDIQSSPL